MSGFAGRVGTAPNAAGRQIALPNQTIYINNINDKLSKELLRRFVSPGMSRLCRVMWLASRQGDGECFRGFSASCCNGFLSIMVYQNYMFWFQNLLFEVIS